MLFHCILYEGNLILSHYFLDEFLILGTTVGKGFYVAVLLFQSIDLTPKDQGINLTPQSETAGGVVLVDGLEFLDLSL